MADDDRTMRAPSSRPDSIRDSRPADLPPEVADAAKLGSNVVGHYVKLRELGRGGMGAVFLAFDTRLSRHVALKFLKANDPEDVARFQREAHLAAGLNHPNISAVYEVGDAPPYIAMQYIDGSSADKRRPNAAEAVRFVRDAALAVQFAHEKGIVHRDLKPENVMVDQRGHVFVMDFGLAKKTDVESTLSRSGMIAGSPAYMSPEQALGHIHLDARTDVYGLGAMLYALLAGRPPYSGSTLEVLQKVVHEEPPALEAPRDLRIIAAKAMEKEAARRYGSAKAMAEDLDRYLAGEAIQARAPSVTYVLTRQFRRHPFRFATGAAIVIAAALGLLLWKGARDTKQADARRREAFDHAQKARDLLTSAFTIPFETGEDFERAEKRAREALAEWSEAIRIDPTYMDARLGRARTLRYLGRHDQATADVDEVIRRWPEVAAGYLERARLRSSVYYKSRGLPNVFVTEGRTEVGPWPKESGDTRAIRQGAERDLADARSRGAGESETRPARAFLEIVAERFDAGETLLTAHLEADETDADAWHDLGLARFLKRDYPGTVKAARQAVRYGRGDSGFWFLLAQGLHATGEPAAALDAVRRCVDIDGSQANARIMLAIFLEGEKKLEEGLLEIDAALKLDPKNAIGHQVRGTILADAGRFSEAREAYDRSIAENPEYYMAYANRAFVRWKLGDVDGSLKDYEKAVACGLDAALGKEHAAGMLIEAQRLDEAVKLCDDVVKLRPEWAKGWETRAKAKFALGEFDGCYDDAMEARKRNPKSVQGSHLLGWIQLRRKQPAAAVEDFTIAMESPAFRGEALHGRGLGYYLMRRLKEAEADLTECETLGVVLTADPRAARGVCRLELGRPKEALEDFERAVKDEPRMARDLQPLIERAKKEAGP